MPVFKCTQEFDMNDGCHAPFTLGKYYKLHSLDNKQWFFINDRDDIHTMPWPKPDDDFNLLEFFTKADER